MAAAGEGAEEEAVATGSGLLGVRSRLTALRAELPLAKLSAVVRMRELAARLTVEEEEEEDEVSGAAAEAVRADATEGEEEVGKVNPEGLAGGTIPVG